jgi:LPS-assembly protein
MRPFRIVPLIAGMLMAAAAASAQQLSGCEFSKQWTIERISTNHWKLNGAVEVQCRDSKFYADHVEFFTDTNKLLASGNVVFTSGGSRIAADNMEFDTQKRTGVFYNASGTASLGERADRSMFGTQEPDAYFYGEKLEKLGEDKYRITKGGFTTCVQPTPRWEITSSSVVLNLNDYAVVRNSVLKVKGVPVFYMPLFYYPIQDDDRATGFLLPTYGGSTIRGPSISNAFFWAIDRSQDLTLMHDWFARTGQGMGAEYRYVRGRGSEGNAEWYFLNEHASTYTDANGIPRTTPGERSYELRTNVMQRLPLNLRARARVDYFTSVTTRQIYQQNIYDASQRTRFLSGNLAGTWRGFNVNAAYDRRQTYFGDTNSTVYGNAPRVAFSRASRRLFGTPLYFGFNGEYANRLYQNRRDEVVTRDRGLSRFDLTPTLRAPLTTWQFLSITSSVAWHGTYYSHSLNARRQQIEEPIFRRYFDLRSEIVGPVLTRVFNTPGNGYAEKFKHVIEPTFTVQRVTAIDNREQIVLLNDSGDYAIGNTTRVTYGLTNRLMAKTADSSSRAGGREILSANIDQSYYSDPRASQFDDQYSTSFRGRAPSKYSPVALRVRASPTDLLSSTLRLEYDVQEGSIQSISAQGDVGVGDWLRTSAGWSQRRLRTSVLDLDPINHDNYLTGSASVRSSGNRLGSTYSFNFDVGRSTMLQQRIIGYYNAQCCGFAVEYQTFDFPDIDRFRVAQDRRFNISFTLAGVGTFSNLLGAFGGNQP